MIGKNRALKDAAGPNSRRRQFIAGLLAVGVVPAPTWADAGKPAYLAAAARSDGTYALCGLNASLETVFRIPLPARGHAAAAHPLRPEAVAFARRPGTFAVVIDCLSGTAKARLKAPEGLHFYGHGAFSASGDWLFTTENDYASGRGNIGVWDVAAGYRRIDGFSSGGIGPHDIKRLPNSDVLVVANGGIDTHPDTGRAKLNIATMQSNLSYLLDGAVMEQAILPPHHQKNSIRHLALSAKGDVAMGMQWEGDGTSPALVARHSRGSDIAVATLPDDLLRALDGYIGSIAFSQNGKTIAVTSPRGSILDIYDADRMALASRTAINDVCGIAPCLEGFALTTGTGALGVLDTTEPRFMPAAAHSWDNHLVMI
ncbi:DUF1513 domain-containing protein [Sulfitobacter guttiformis]|uniref:DUF1513 domain-containing protein n=1 Tax=Sulfitobacter guttiformis TaxID=74349 RepID=A0A420DI03_9RHOB|nr:DUF1513 domain-containing protein [Sulfitobacter guttiformis]KIN72378.1 Twin-arginine translocation pathway signal protein [Sulfitobacter guttiformis KCTC 32187]RKE93866.1 hypothetical protein C8N30_2967 [Sulfitobacter guttiformis]